MSLLFTFMDSKHSSYKTSLGYMKNHRVSGDSDPANPLVIFEANNIKAIKAG